MTGTANRVEGFRLSGGIEELSSGVDGDDVIPVPMEQQFGDVEPL